VNVLNSLYFLGGVLATLMGLYVIGDSKPKKKVVPQKWTSIEHLGWNFDYDYDYEEARTAMQIGKAMAYAMWKKVEEDPMPSITIEPGRYRVHFEAKGVLTKRET
jgi:hypothetical protein